MNLEDWALVAILAATDAVFIPSRDPRSLRHRIICERRSAAGIPWASERVLPGAGRDGSQASSAGTGRIDRPQLGGHHSAHRDQNAGGETDRRR